MVGMPAANPRNPVRNDSRRPWRRWLVLLLAVALLAPFLPQPGGGPVAKADIIDELQKKIEEQKNRRNQIDQRINQLENSIRATRGKQAVTQARIESLDQQIAATEEQLKQVQLELEKAQAEVERLTTDLEIAKNELAWRQELLARRVRAIYENGQVSYLEVLFSATSFSDFLSRFDRLQQVIAGDRKLVASVTEKKEEVERLKAEAEEHRSQVVALRDQVESMKKSLEVQIASKRQELDELRQTESLLLEQIEEMERLSEQTAQMIRELEKQLEKELARQGRLLLRYPLDKEYRITSPYGYRYHPISRSYKLHTGVDIGAWYNTPIYAAESGLVIQAGWYGGYGNAVIILHGNSISTLYGHMAKVTVSAKQRVSKGQLIGYVGSTGYSTGPHLHFEVRRNGEPVDPGEYIPQFR